MPFRYTSYRAFDSPTPTLNPKFPLDYPAEFYRVNKF